MEPLRHVFVVRFGTYEVSFQSGEVRKAGVRVRVQQQPLKLLEVLLERPGEVVTREELRSRVWPDESFGDFDQAVNIAERVMDMVELPAVELPVDIPRMATAVGAMVRRALESFVEGKAELAQAVLEMDHVVDRMRDEAFIMLVRKMNESPEVTQQALDALLVARNLERVADHATNIAEDVIFWVLGADVRHHAQTLAAAQTPARPGRQEQQ